MPQNKERRSLAIIINARSQRWRQLYTRTSVYSDHCYFVSRKDLLSRAVDPGDHFLADPRSNFEAVCVLGEGVSDLVIFSSSGTARDLDIVLDAVEPQLCAKSSITLGGFRISAPQFQSLTERFEDVHLVGCHLMRGWWKPVTEDRPCKNLTLDLCTGASPPDDRVGTSGWPSLKRLYLDTGSEGDSVEQFAAVCVRCFWHERLRDLNLQLEGPLDFLTPLPPSRSLTSLGLWSAVSPSVFAWLLNFKSLDDLAVTWEPGVHLNWRELRHLKRLRLLNVTYSPLDDAQLREIATHPRLRSVHAYSTKLTPASWPVILSWLSLRQFWGSTELSGGPIPAGLPETTTLREFVALNARTEWFEGMLSRYPNVKVVQM